MQNTKARRVPKTNASEPKSNRTKSSNSKTKNSKTKNSKTKNSKSKDFKGKDFKNRSRKKSGSDFKKKRRPKESRFKDDMRDEFEAIEPEVKTKPYQAIKFNSLNLSPEVLNSIEQFGFDTATEIQAKAIPALLQAKDLIAQASTGTGKTLAFGIPCIESIDVEDKKVQALIMCPTRELAVQVSNEIKKLANGQKIFVTPVYGGQDMKVQLRFLKMGTHIVVGTPGRIRDHLQRGTLKLGKVKYLVLDEADQMLDMGFAEEINDILGRVPKDRQTVMFSATMSPKLRDLAQTFMNKPEHINLVGRNNASNKKIKQLCMNMKNSAKDSNLENLLEEYKIFSGIIFCNTKRKVDELTRILLKKKYSAASIHGDIKQRKRDQVMKNFKKGDVELLVATDVAARGIDVNDLEAVINYDLPRFDEDYIHRIGRTGRAGKEGLAINFVTKNDVSNIRRIAKKHKLKMETVS